jgi:hypothetical protein
MVTTKQTREEERAAYALRHPSKTPEQKKAREEHLAAEKIAAPIRQAARAAKESENELHMAQKYASMQEDLKTFGGSRTQWRTFANDKYRDSITRADGSTFGRVYPELYDRAWAERVAHSSS